MSLVYTLSFAAAFSAMREVKSVVGMDEVFALFFDPLGRGMMNTLLYLRDFGL